MESAASARPTKYCTTCGASIDAQAEICPKCGVRQPGFPAAPSPESDRRILPALLLCLLLGVLGVHRFYVGKVGTGILMILTFGGFGIWVVVDLIAIVTGNFRDAQARRLNVWT